jgi:hypothetical protein
MNKSLYRHLLLLGCVFALTRAWPIAVAEPWSYWEVFEAKKLNYYGWAERRGALLDVHYLAGVVPRPELHNYPNHPAPIHWVNMLFHRVLGDWGVVTLGLSLGIAACLAALFALRQIYTPSVALIGALLFTIAPSSIIYDIDPNQGAIGAIVWPFAALALGSPSKSKWHAWLLGGACLLSGQASWMVWVVFGALLVAAFGISWLDRFVATPDQRSIVAVLVGGGLTVAIFVLQVLFYTPDWDNLASYLNRQSIEHQVGVSTWIMRMVTRSGMSLGPALVLGSLAGFIAILAIKAARPFELACIMFFPLFVGASFVLRGFFDEENWPYEYLMFPASVLCCAFLAAVPAGKLWRASAAGLLVLGVVGLPYVFLRFSNPILSAETRFIADLIATEARPDEVVATNLVEQAPPLQQWNVSGLYTAMHKADRLLRWNVNDLHRVGLLLELFHADTLQILFIRTNQQPVEPPLRLILEENVSQQFSMPVHGGELPLSLRLRNYYWHLTGRHRAPEAGLMQGQDNTLELSRLTICRDSGGNIVVRARSTKDSAPGETQQNYP